MLNNIGHLTDHVRMGGEAGQFTKDHEPVQVLDTCHVLCKSRVFSPSWFSDLLLVSPPVPSGMTTFVVPALAQAHLPKSKNK